MSKTFSLSLLLLVFELPAFSQTPVVNQYEVDHRNEMNRQSENRATLRALDELRRNQEALLHDQKKLEGVADDIRQLRYIEEQRYRDEKAAREKEESLRIEAIRKERRDQMLLSIQTLEGQVANGVALTQNQLDWIRELGKSAKAYIEDPEIKYQLNELENGFAGVGGTYEVRLSRKALAQRLREAYDREWALFQRLSSLNAANNRLLGVAEVEPFQQPEIVPGPIPEGLRPKISATSEVESRKRALMNQR